VVIASSLHCFFIEPFIFLLSLKMSENNATSTQPQSRPHDDVRIETRQYEDQFRHRLSLPEASNLEEKRLRDMGNMYAAYNMMMRTASPVVNGQNSERPLRMGNPGVIGNNNNKSSLLCH
jgi:hypothetical protein